MELVTVACPITSMAAGFQAMVEGGQNSWDREFHSLGTTTGNAIYLFHVCTLTIVVCAQVI